jgi:hypothetical protein
MDWNILLRGSVVRCAGGKCDRNVGDEQTEFLYEEYACYEADLLKVVAWLAPLQDFKFFRKVVRVLQYHSLEHNLCLAS